MYITKSNMYLAEKKSGISGGELMDHAGMALFHHMLHLLSSSAKIVVFCGKGNNGGDGIVLAHLLKEKGFHTELYLAEKPTSLLTIEKLEKFEREFGTDYQIYHEKQPITADFIIDGIFGIGFNGDPSPFYKQLFQKINQSPATVISIDIPSGLASDTPFFHHAIKADYTFIIQRKKLSAGLMPSKAYYGKISVLDIQIPIHTPPVRLIEEITIPKREPTSHKGHHGKGLLIAGSDYMPGAATISALAAVKSGLGLLTVKTTEKAQHIVSSHVLEAMFHQPDTGFSSYDVIAVGPGIGREDSHNIRELLKEEKTIIIDADGLYHLTNNMDWLKQKKGNTVILTPHEGEMARLMQRSVNDIREHRFQVSYQLATEYQVYVVLKGANTIVTTPNGEQFVNTTGNATLAKGGSGDMLTGMLLGLVPQYKNVTQAITSGVFLHGQTSDTYVKKYHNQLTASLTDLIELLPKVIGKYNK